MSNYFTDEQLEEIAIEYGILEFHIDYPEKFKSLMNLAVSTAIGEPVIKVMRGSDSRLLLLDPENKYFDVNDAIGKTFYTIKELPNG
jgi:hypothetical protein